MIRTLKQFKKLVDQPKAGLVITKDTAGPDYTIIILEQDGHTMHCLSGSLMQRLKKELVVFPTNSFLVNKPKLDYIAG